MMNLMTDFAFKRFFGTEPYKKNLIHFLNAFISQYIGKVRDISYKQTEQLGLRNSEKRLVFDVFCNSQRDDNIIVEMQKTSQNFINDRALAYSSRIISNSLVKGDRRYKYPTVISIILADFEIPELKGSDSFYMHISLKDDENKIFSKKMSFLLVDLTKFAAGKSFGQLRDERQKWCYVIKNMWHLTDGDIPEDAALFHELYEDCKLSKLDDMEKQDYEKSVLEYEDVKDAMEWHRKMGRNEGRKEGRKEGKAEGIKEGIEEGKKTALISTAKNLLKLGISVADVIQATGLSEKEVSAIKLENKLVVG